MKMFRGCVQCWRRFLGFGGFSLEVLFRVTKWPDKSFSLSGDWKFPTGRGREPWVPTEGLAGARVSLPGARVSWPARRGGDGLPTPPAGLPARGLLAPPAHTHVDLIRNVLIFRHTASWAYHLWPTFLSTAFLLSFPSVLAPLTSVRWYIISYQQCIQSVPFTAHPVPALGTGAGF